MIAWTWSFGHAAWPQIVNSKHLQCCAVVHVNICHSEALFQHNLFIATFCFGDFDFILYPVYNQSVRLDFDETLWGRKRVCWDLGVDIQAWRTQWYGHWEGWCAAGVCSFLRASRASHSLTLSLFKVRSAQLDTACVSMFCCTRKPIVSHPWAFFFINAERRCVFLSFLFFLCSVASGLAVPAGSHAHQWAPHLQLACNTNHPVDGIARHASAMQMQQHLYQWAA